MFLGWLKALPDDAVRRRPVLSVFYGWMLMVSGDLDAFEPRLDDAERTLAAVPDGSAPPWADTEALHTLPATIAVYRASLAQARGDVAGTSEHARHALDLAGPGDHLARGGAAGFLGLAAWAKGDVSTALRTFTQWQACAQPAIWSTSSAARSCSLTCGSRPVNPTRHAVSTSVLCSWPRHRASRGRPPTCTWD
jgi:ATP/maltotriose-dependent transcriptional regulator MalT